MNLRCYIVVWIMGYGRKTVEALTTNGMGLLAVLHRYF